MQCKFCAEDTEIATWDIHSCDSLLSYIETIQLPPGPFAQLSPARSQENPSNQSPSSHSQASRPVVVRPQCSSTSPLITRPLHSRCQSRQSLELMSSASLPSTSESSGVHTTETRPSCSGVPIRIHSHNQSSALFRNLS